MIKKCIIALLVIIGLYIAAGWFFSEDIIHFSKRTLEEDRVHVELQKVSDVGLPEPETIAIESDAHGSEKQVLKGWFFKNPRFEQAKCGVILQHGFKSTRWAVLKYAPLFWDRGCSILSVDARFHGESGGQCGTFGFHESKDMQSILYWMTTKTGLPKSKIGLLGESMGGTIVFLAAAREPELAFVAIDSTPSDMNESFQYEGSRKFGSVLTAVMMAVSMTIAELRCDFESDQISPKKVAKDVQSPVFISHSKSDESVPVYHAEVNYKGLIHTKKLLFLNDWGASHVRDLNVNYEEYKKHMNQFLDQYVPDFGKLK
ncbi:hypothetical protein CH373_07190 [Leptospira perolatii]|uniref:Xaa-Pro dipeptidyl-peptidase-like domain-containing protein n=1 Tax=Leptospira perolatii TaxID=2023191 RepID=A0A2M9ZPB8_9LEPT|nr:alpha/beta fold hydrolase [Leptospira perolatii]PJZ70706.1 hypothetical protein CH360_04050 [Leptospira perolatii]PJZ73916.1 hypothetical protein CH373_07190 [Leptospira perolatii]